MLRASKNDARSIVSNPSGEGGMPGSGAALRGSSLYCEEHGNGFPLVLISGGGVLDRRGWDQQFETFARDYRVVRYDVRGIGKSVRPTESFSHSDDLYELLAALRIERAHFVALS